MLRNLWTAPLSFLYAILAPRERPKLQLAKRDEAHAAAEEHKDAAAKSSIFGGAKPVDTTKREKEIEEKLKKPTTGEHR